MKINMIGVGGVVAHAASLLIAQYSQWLLAKVIHGKASVPFPQDLQLFVHWLLRGMADRVCDRRPYLAARDEDDDWQPELFNR